MKLKGRLGPYQKGKLVHNFYFRKMSFRSCETTLAMLINKEMCGRHKVYFFHLFCFPSLLGRGTNGNGHVMSLARVERADFITQITYIVS